MKRKMMINLLAGSGLAFGSFQAVGGGFGGGWSHDSSGTLHYSEAPEVTSSAPARKHPMASGFGGGWRHDGSGTLTYSHAESPEPQAVPGAGRVKIGRSESGFGGGWRHDSTGTLSRDL